MNPRASIRFRAFSATLKPTVVMPLSERANTVPLCITATALTIDSPSPWFSPLLRREESTR